MTNTTTTTTEINDIDRAQLVINMIRAGRDEQTARRDKAIADLTTSIAWMGSKIDAIAEATSMAETFNAAVITIDEYELKGETPVAAIAEIKRIATSRLMHTSLMNSTSMGSNLMGLTDRMAQSSILQLINNVGL